MGLRKLLIFLGIVAVVSSTVVWEKTWINNNKPFRNGTEIEAAPGATYLNSVCPSSKGRLALRCKTGNETPFLIVMNDTARYFEVTCVPLKGLSCKPYTGYNTSCPDFQMNYGCDIPTSTLKATQTTSVTQSRPRGSTRNRSLRGGAWPPPSSSVTSTKSTPTSNPTTSSMTSSKTPKRRSTRTSPKPSSNKSTMKHLSTSIRSTARTNVFVTSSAKGRTSVSNTHAQTKQAASGTGKQCTCNNGRNAGSSVIYNNWMCVALLLSFVSRKTLI